MLTCSWRGAVPLMACLHAGPLNRVVVFGVTVAKSFGGGYGRRLHPAPYSVSIQFRQSRVCAGSQSKRQTEEEKSPHILLKAAVQGYDHNPKQDHKHSVIMAA
jgi:hypothetical protein